MNAFRMIALAALLAACFMHGPVAAQGPFGAGAQSSVRYGSARFKIKVPPARKSSSARRGFRPLYVSPSTKSFAISAAGLPTVVANVNPSTGEATVTVRVPVGAYTFVVTAYDRPGATGNVLSTGSTGPVDVGPGYITVYLTLSGVVASLALALDYPHPTIGSPATTDLEAIAKDADGNVILSPYGTSEPLNKPFTLTSSDPVNGRLSQTTIQQTFGANTGFRVSVTYSGANVPSITFSAAGGGLGAGAITPATLVPLAPPTSGEQLIAQQLEDPVNTFSTLPSHQFLGTLPFPPGVNSRNSLAVDAAARRIYIQNQDYPHSAIEIFQASGSYAMVGSISTPMALFGGLAIDSTTGEVFSGQATNGNGVISVYGTSAGHALIGTIRDAVAAGAALAVDETAGRLYAAGCPDSFGCHPGFEVFSVAAPYQNLGQYGWKGFGTTYCSVAVDAQTERLFLSECNLPNENPSYIDVYEAADLKNRVARIGPLTPAAQLAIDSKARVLYVTRISDTVGIAIDHSVDMYGLDDGFSLLGSIPIRSVDHIAVAPFTP
jgi:hypothetical protein